MPDTKPVSMTTTDVLVTMVQEMHRHNRAMELQARKDNDIQREIAFALRADNWLGERMLKVLKEVHGVEQSNEDEA